MAADSPALPSPNVPGYTLESKIGSGSFATVYRALTAAPSPNGTRQVVAIKCVSRKKAARTASSADNLVREIALLKRLRHRHIVRMLDFRWDDRNIYLITELCAGGDLSAFIRRRRALPEDVTRKFVRQLASAMHYLHEEQVAHLDLKPQNLLLTKGARPWLKVADFGLAQHLRDDVSANGYRGSPLYMAPEMLAGRRYDARADLWSIGVILYECVFGSAPFASGSLEELEKRIVSGERVHIPQAPVISHACQDIIKGLLQSDPNERLSFEEFFAHPFVELSSAPSEGSLSAAEQTASQAVSADRAGRAAAAVKLYAAAIGHYLSALRFADGEAERARLRQTVDRYLRRAESLKASMRQLLTPSNSASDGGSKPEENMVEAEQLVKQASSQDQLRILWEDTPQVHAGLTVVSRAEELTAAEDFSGALGKYELVVDSMLRLLSDEPQGERRRLLHERLREWLRRAEQLKSYVEVSGLGLSELEEREKADDRVEMATEALAKDNQCVLQ